MIAQVIINSNVKNLNRIFDYNVPAEMEGTICVGDRILVPFGNKKTLEEGFVIGFKESSEFKVKDVAGIQDGVKLTVKDGSVISLMDSGLVIFKGNKEGYGDTVIVQRPDNVEVWYSNLKNINVSLYDYVSSGYLLGESCDNYLYLLYNKDNNAANKNLILRDDLFCKYCSKKCKNLNSLRQHEIRCKENPDRIIPKTLGMRRGHP